jgi:hypothetical protein
MRTLILFWFLIIGLNAYAQQGTSPAIDLHELGWLVGTWTRTNAKPDRQAYEQWVKINDRELWGRGVTIKEGDTLFVEKLRIILRNDTIYYVADVPENNRLIYFRFTKLDDNGFICENPSHDFPKKISYNRREQSLHAQISGDGKAIDYFFEREK